MILKLLLYYYYNMPIIYIEGNIGTGKSTFIENLKTYLDFYGRCGIMTYNYLSSLSRNLITP